VTNAGYGYTNAPSVLIDPPNGQLFGQTNSTFTISNASPNSLGNYYVVATGRYGSVTSSVVNLTLLYPPGILAQPQDQVVDGNGVASFGVGTTGTSPFSYQWLFQGTNLPDSNTGTLTIPDVTPQNLGSYAVIVANNYGSVTSSIANLYMYPYLASPFSGVNTDWGQTNVLNVGAWGSGNLVYQWYFNGAALPGATSSNLVLSGIQFTNAGLYTVVVSSSYGSVTNTPEQVVVNPAGVSLGLFAGVIIQGTVGYHYTVQSSTDLSNPNSWNTLTNLTLTSPLQFWSDYSIDVRKSSPRFYRVVPGQ
jgi:Immunoglobulin I-set domain